MNPLNALMSPADVGSSFYNGLAQGMELGRAYRDARERKEYRNALGVLATEPENQNALTTVFQHNPQVGISLMNRADDAAFGRDTASMMQPLGQPNALLALPGTTSAQTAPIQLQPTGAQQANGDAPAEVDLSVLGQPQSEADQAFLRMVRRDPKKALEIRSDLRDNFLKQAEAEAEFYGLAMGELSRATDQASWVAGLRAIMPRAKALNLNLMQHVPSSYPGPEGVRELMERAQPIKDQLDLMVREANMAADNERADRNTDSLIETRERRAGEYERRGRANEAIRIRGQNMTDARASRGRGGRRGSGGDDLPTFNSPAEARGSGLPSGTRFKSPDGRTLVMP